MATQTFQQERAKYALKQVQQYAEDVSCHKEFKSRASELPFMIHANGLGQALAFFKSKANEKNPHGYDHLYKILSEWLCKEGQPFEKANDKMDAIEYTVKEANRAQYMAAQAEAILLMDWVKKFSRAFMGGE